MRAIVPEAVAVHDAARNCWSSTR